MTYKFIVTGGIDVPPSCTEILSFDKRVIGFTMPDGREVRPYLALEIKSLSEETVDISHSDEIEAMGFTNLDYELNEFEQVDDNEVDDEEEVDHQDLEEYPETLCFHDDLLAEIYG
ncbi:hypothetical protein [Pseudanabaena sp. 'Roaring Creek']|uniref:hypothetical protein n=1 Tax=Pseudanabaena sp. 'Roaring Creek' TaxID=1681830 RepID=UPI0006D7901D|nr:hypothetical protein [Pseudanabaena sp. 'Roaring Creek']